MLRAATFALDHHGPGADDGPTSIFVGQVPHSPVKAARERKLHVCAFIAAMNEAKSARLVGVS